VVTHTEEFSHLTFSQREGLVPIPGPLKLGELSDDLRRDIADYFFKVFENNRKRNSIHHKYQDINKHLIPAIAEFKQKSLKELNDEILNEDILNFCQSTIAGKKVVRPKIIHVQSYSKVLDFLELCLNKSNRFSGNEIESVFKKHQAAYTLVNFKNKGHWNFHPITSEANRTALQHNLNAVEEARYSGAIEHFIKASNAIKGQDFKRAVAESHSASEAIARDMTGESTLGDSLKKLKSDPDIDNTLISGMDKITAFAHSFRHGSEPQPDNMSVGQDEAILMFSVNAAISGYLAVKARRGRKK